MIYIFGVKLKVFAEITNGNGVLMEVFIPSFYLRGKEQYYSLLRKC